MFRPYAHFKVLHASSVAPANSELYRRSYMNWYHTKKITSYYRDKFAVMPTMTATRNVPIDLSLDEMFTRSISHCGPAIDKAVSNQMRSATQS